MQFWHGQELCERNIRCPYDDSPKNIPFYVEAFNARNESFYQLKALPQNNTMKKIASMLSGFVDLAITQYFADLSICLFWPDHIALLEDMVLEKANKEKVYKLSNSLKRNFQILKAHFASFCPYEFSLDSSIPSMKRKRKEGVDHHNEVEVRVMTGETALVDETRSKRSSVSLNGTTCDQSSVGGTIFSYT